MLKKVVIAISLLGAPAITFAQAVPTASRAGDLQIGGGISNANTDYVPNRVNGGTVYVDFDFYRHFGVEGEFRFLKDGKTNIYEKTYEVGGRYSRVYHNRFVPYGKVMYGRGVFNFANNGQTYANLAYNMFAGGIGLDYRVLTRVNVRAEYEYQKWMSFPPNGLSPSVITIGAAYHFPAGKLSIAH
ncbi:porin family protein [Edaphobacter flagellatus]|uniref:porin family protein n=1 Tax=Edaphobacter flagellatus TaxID=1933044 RepID=UPI0021B37FF0|nr:porin family protein [Edaphobacter flagellatus]